MADLQGPKIRVGKLENGFVELLAGEKLLLDAAHEGEGNRDHVGLDYRDLPNDVKAGDILLLDDGLLTLVVTSVNGSEIHTAVQNSHKLKSNEGINKQGGGLSAGALAEKDFRDLKTAIGIGCDYLAVSFVKSARACRSPAIWWSRKCRAAKPCALVWCRKSSAWKPSPTSMKSFSLQTASW